MANDKTTSTELALRTYLENMVAEGLLAQKLGVNCTPSQIVDGTIGQITQIIENAWQKDSH